MANHRHDAGREKRPAGVIPRKRFGQHFLADRACIDAIVQAIAPRSGDNLVEIGPGTGVLTAPLVAQTGHITVIEIDRDLGPRLAAQYGDALTLVQQDVLQVDFSGFGQNLRIVGNLPYNISSPLLLHLIAVADRVRDQHFMLQKEVVDRIVAGPGSDMGRLTVFLQNHYQVVKLFDVPPEAFDPPPKVDSAWCAWCRCPGHTRPPLPSWRPRWPQPMRSAARCCVGHWGAGWPSNIHPLIWTRRRPTMHGWCR